MDRPIALNRLRYRERRLNNHGIMRVPSSGSPGNLVFLTNCHILGPMGTTQARTPKEGGGYNGEKPYIITRYISETLEEDIVTMES